MEWIVINSNQIKLMLSKADMESYTGDTKEVLREIMNEARAKCGFPDTESRLFIQMYPSRQGDCEMFVTRLNSTEPLLQMGEGTVTEVRRGVGKTSGSHVIYAFRELPYLLGCCLELYRMGYSGYSTAYHDPGSKTYYLLLEYETPAASENFGSLCPSRTYYYINEHCDVVCQTSAVDTLGRLA